jgi:hypothetical protein
VSLSTKKALSTMDDIAQVVEGWIADRQLSRRKAAFLEEGLQRSMEAMPVGSPDVAPGEIAEALDLPAGAYWVQVIASLLDYTNPRPGVPRLNEVEVDLEAYGLLDPSFAGTA